LLAPVRQVAGVQQRGQRFVVALWYAADFGVELIVVVFHQHFGVGVAVALHALAQVMGDGLLQRPVAKADHAAIVGVGEEAGDAFGAAQFQVDIGVGGGAQRERREGEACKFQHAQILFSEGKTLVEGNPARV